MADEPWWHSEGQDRESADALGSAAQEAARLFGAMRDRMMADPATMRAGFKIMEAMTMLGRSGRAVAPGEAPECAYCPFCQAMSRARNLSPETVERLTGAAMEFADVVRQVVGQGGGAADDGVVRHVPLDDDIATWGADDELVGATDQLGPIEEEPEPLTDSAVDSWFETPDETPEDAATQGQGGPPDEPTDEPADDAGKPRRKRQGGR